MEEKLDGANAGIGFSADGELRLQSRGHFLTGGPREQQFNLFKAWAASVRHALWPRRRDRYVLYGEWLYAEHTIIRFYLRRQRIPHTSTERSDQLAARARRGHRRCDFEATATGAATSSNAASTSSNITWDKLEAISAPPS
ncbi:hypothetical protein Arub01_46570 [Actinomadura rubrobrunea]|uniref:RNA ligase domain-containing protein n=1 Tax=Actinomadura rubrobrunea TaxID=115335 RepID=A0A9W6Q0W1_9ACTN|nr:hypothetical protein Arub01_46570 [Actinomadura rubrobrunea]